jgi:2-polyprenyl-6-methoxyphenol hydroxylase-like FAD-dependent oxidoreductase
MASPAAVFARLSDPNPPTDTPVVLGTAVVLGGSVGGLLAARVLADHAESVLVVERDDPGTSTEPRPGVPQGNQIHGLLPSGLVQLERWFPGFTEQTLAAGGRMAPASARRTYIEGVRKAAGSQTNFLTGSRPFLEAQMRRRTLALPNVKSIVGRATGLDFDGGAVTGVRVESDGAETVERADFVVDAMGRSSRLSDWLEQAGWERPAMQRMHVDVNYATTMFHRDRDDFDLNGVIAYGATGGSTDATGANFIQIEGDRWQVLVAGFRDNKPGRTIEDLRAFCAGYPAEFAEVAAKEPVGEPQTYRHADSRRRDFHALRRLPARLIATGDAVASFNPVYGQGMSSAILHASALSEYLRSRPDLSRPARRFFALQKVLVDAAWETSTRADLELPHVDGPYPRGYWLMKRIGGQMTAAAVHDTDISRRFDEVTYMLKHPSTLAKPGVLLRAFLVNRRARERAQDR